jgi:hypothetical protein
MVYRLYYQSWLFGKTGHASLSNPDFTNLPDAIKYTSQLKIPEILEVDSVDIRLQVGGKFRTVAIIPQSVHFFNPQPKD